MTKSKTETEREILSIRLEIANENLQALRSLTTRVEDSLSKLSSMLCREPLTEAEKQALIAFAIASRGRDPKVSDLLVEQLNGSDCANTILILDSITHLLTVK